MQRPLMLHSMRTAKALSVAPCGVSYELAIAADRTRPAEGTAVSGGIMILLFIGYLLRRRCLSYARKLCMT